MPLTYLFNKLSKKVTQLGLEKPNVAKAYKSKKELKRRINLSD